MRLLSFRCGRRRGRPSRRCSSAILQALHGKDAAGRRRLTMSLRRGSIDRRRRAAASTPTGVAPTRAYFINPAAVGARVMTLPTSMPLRFGALAAERPDDHRRPRPQRGGEVRRLSAAAVAADGITGVHRFWGRLGDNLRLLTTTSLGWLTRSVRPKNSRCDRTTKFRPRSGTHRRRRSFRHRRQDPSGVPWAMLVMV